MPKKVSYKAAGVDISKADAAKKEMAGALKTDNPLVLNTVGAFSSLCDASFPGYKHPVLVCKTEEPGTKQLLAFQHKKTEGICFDLINHLINDVIVMGAKPLFLQDLIVCGKLEPDVVKSLVKDFAKACTAQGAVLTGGETSEQPGVLEAGTYVLGASCIGVVEKSQIIDGSAICEGDTVLALASSGLHTNGYTLVRALLKEDPTFADIGSILTPHRCYYNILKDLFGNKALHGMAHITGGGIPGNLNRILPKGLDALIDASSIKILPIFKRIKEASGNDDADMIRTFNLGVGLTIVVDSNAVPEIVKHIKAQDCDCYPIGVIESGGSQKVVMKNNLQW